MLYSDPLCPWSGLLVFIDLMEKNPNGNGSAAGLPVFAGSSKQMISSTPYDPKSGWRFGNFDMMGEVAPLPESVKVAA